MDLLGRQRLTTAGSRLRLRSGGHFFLHEAAEQILTTVSDSVGSRDADLAGTLR